MNKPIAVRNYKNKTGTQVSAHRRRKVGRFLIGDVNQGYAYRPVTKNEDDPLYNIDSSTHTQDFSPSAGLRGRMAPDMWRWGQN
ncbi:MAG: hypothetical protein WBM24_02735 [Candidatus Sulfotelmatobacter sp.]